MVSFIRNVSFDTADRDRDAELDRLLGLGATILSDFRAENDGQGWIVLQDPEGNEFCLGRAA